MLLHLSERALLLSSGGQGKGKSYGGQSRQGPDRHGFAKHIHAPAGSVLNGF